jgi:lysophospholipase L1-like esterase
LTPDAARSQAVLLPDVRPKHRRSAAWCLNVAVALVAALLPCVGAEIVLRALSPAADTPGLFVKTSTETEWSGRPGAQGLFAGAAVSFNRFGLRDRERSLERAPGTTRIVVLGDSVTFGLGVAEARAFPRVTETLLNASSRHRLLPVEVLNFGMPGYNTVHELAQLRELGLAFHPDVVVVGLLYNDVEPSTAQALRLGRIHAEHPPAVAGHLSLAREVRSDINGVITALKKRSLFVSWLTPRLGLLLRPLGAKGFGQVGEVKDQYVDSNLDWQWLRAALLDMKALCEDRKIGLVVAIIPAMAKFTDSGYPIREYHAAVSGFCRAHSITCLDLLPPFWGMDGTQFWISPTDGHPDARAHRVIAGALADFLAPRLPRTPAVADGGPDGAARAARP